MTKYWVGVASREHVRKAVEGGFCQLDHGREAPLKRLACGDGIIYYSPRDGMKTGEPLRAFTAIGRVRDDKIRQAVQSEGFNPFRRNVFYFCGTAAPIHPLLEKLSFTRGKRTWGQVMRRGVFEIERDDFDLIAAAMDVSKRGD